MLKAGTKDIRALILSSVSLTRIKVCKSSTTLTKQTEGFNLNKLITFIAINKGLPSVLGKSTSPL
jgi:hypothetical protein